MDKFSLKLANVDDIFVVKAIGTPGVNTIVNKPISDYIQWSAGEVKRVGDSPGETSNILIDVNKNLVLNSVLQGITTIVSGGSTSPDEGIRLEATFSHPDGSNNLASGISVEGRNIYVYTGDITRANQVPLSQYIKDNSGGGTSGGIVKFLDPHLNTLSSNGTLESVIFKVDMGADGQTFGGYDLYLDDATVQFYDKEGTDRVSLANFTKNGLLIKDVFANPDKDKYKNYSAVNQNYVDWKIDNIPAVDSPITSVDTNRYDITNKKLTDKIFTTVGDGSSFDGLKVDLANSKKLEIFNGSFSMFKMVPNTSGTNGLQASTPIGGYDLSNKAYVDSKAGKTDVELTAFILNILKTNAEAKNDILAISNTQMGGLPISIS